MTPLVAIEGIAGTGKTTLLQCLKEKQEFQHSAFVEEFFLDYLDGFLQALHKRDPYFRLHAVHPTPIAQACVFAGALGYKYETGIATHIDKVDCIFVDRYIGTFLTHQGHILLHGVEDISIRQAWLNATSQLLPRPHLTIYLHGNVDDILERLSARGDKVDASARHYLLSIQENYDRLYQHAPDATTINVSEQTTSGTANMAARAIFSRFPQLNHNPRFSLG